MAHEGEEKMQEKIKMTQEKDENFVYIYNTNTVSLSKIFTANMATANMAFLYLIFYDFDYDQLS